MMFVRCAIAATLLLVACQRAPSPPPPPSLPTLSPTQHQAAIAQLEQRECARCHDGLPGRNFPTEKHCVHCHQQILGGTFAAPADALAKWQGHLRSLREVPSLFEVGRLYRRAWIEAFLQTPYDVRPRLRAMMPRLSIAPADAATLAALLVPSEAPPRTFDRARISDGERVWRAKQCASCHRFLEDALPTTDPPATPIALAPDLRHARDRLQSGALIAWLRDPRALRPQTSMPNLAITDDEAESLAAYLWLSPLPAESHPVPARLPVLSRRVGWDEVSDRVFRRTCWHCHSQPDYALGDGGPGNTGGFGRPARGLDLSDTDGRGLGRDRAERQTYQHFLPLPDGTPKLLAHLLARQRELAGVADPTLIGMPLALPPLDPEQIQLVESWIAQGRPR